jgi:branched-chain amino acid transport system substrate-binding protein
VLIGIDAEFGHATSTSAQAIERGAQVAIDTVNAAGGVLGGRPLALALRDNRAVPRRAIENLRDLAGQPDLVAVLTGKFSPTVIESLPTVQEMKVPLLAAWSAADEIVDNGFQPNYVFRLSLRDSWALEAMIRHALRDGRQRLGLLLPNTAWGRSSRQAAERHLKGRAAAQLSGVGWYNWGDQTLLTQYRELRASGAQALLLVANEVEGAILVREMAALPAAERLPIAAHWGLTGGSFVKLAGPALSQVDLAVVQTYSFIGADDPVARRVLAALRQRWQIEDPRAIEAPVGVAHAHDLVLILARAIELAGGTDRAAVRDALEQVRDVRGLVRHYARPFTPARHEALGPEHVFLARYDEQGALLRVTRRAEH